MKVINVLKSFAALAVAAFAMVACGGQAHAAPMANRTYVSTDNKAFSLDGVRQITNDGAGHIVLTFTDGNNSGGYLADAGGVVFAQIKQTQPTLVTLSSNSNVLYNPAYARYVTCNASGGTLTLGWAAGGSEWVSDPSCVTYNAIKNTPH